MLTVWGQDERFIETYYKRFNKDPDSKDWTWVLERPCPDCGFDTRGFAVTAVPGMIMANAEAWQAALAGDARTRPDPGKWSPLEYGCHVRDVLRLYDQRRELMLTQDDP
ncbi:hypothetical protein B4Q13_16235, partial [Lacticaseibacillus rhamnosus]